MDFSFPSCVPFVALDEPHAAAAGSMLPLSPVVPANHRRQGAAAAAAGQGVGADSTTDRGGAAVQERRRSAKAMAANAEQAQAKTRLVKEKQSARDENVVPCGCSARSKLRSCSNCRPMTGLGTLGAPVQRWSGRRGAR